MLMGLLLSRLRAPGLNETAIIAPAASGLRFDAQGFGL